MMNRIFFLFLLVALIASCESKSEHKPLVGSVDNIIPQPQKVNVTEGVTGFFTDGKIVVSGFDNLGESKSVVENWLVSAGIKLEYSNLPGASLLLHIDEGIEGE